jgi:hypothetical protein
MKLRLSAHAIENKRIMEGSRIASAYCVQVVLAFGWVDVRSKPPRYSPVKSAGLQDCYCQTGTFVINWPANDVTR